MQTVILVKYIGTSFEGFQAQPSGNTVQQHLTEALSRAVGFSVNVTGCSRTDSGVHARGFVCSVVPKGDVGREITIPPSKLHRAVRPYLHPHVSVVGGALCDDDFHPRYSAVGKEYVYLIDDSGVYDPFLRDRALSFGRTLSDTEIQALDGLCESFCGRHGFGSFMSAGSKITDTVRTVKYAHLKRQSDGTLAFTVAADGFLYNMVRIMVGTVLDIAKGRDIDIHRAVVEENRSLAGATAPAHGLYLNRVFYDPEIRFICD